MKVAYYVFASDQFAGLALSYVGIAEEDIQCNCDGVLCGDLNIYYLPQVEGEVLNFCYQIS